MFAVEKWRKVARGFLALPLAAVILLGPGYGQVLHRSSPWIPQWRMFSGMATTMLATHIRVIDSSGKERVVGWSELDEPHPPNKRVQAVRVRSPFAVTRQARKICEKVGTGAQVYVRARRATPKGWEPLRRGELDLCRARNRTLYASEQEYRRWREQ